MARKEFKQAIKCRFEGRMSEAEAIYKKIVIENPNSADAQLAQEELNKMHHSVDEYEIHREEVLLSNDPGYFASQGPDQLMKVDNEKKTVEFISYNIHSGKENRAVAFQDILEFELIENNGVITQGGLGSAAVGGLLLGNAGVLAGAVIGKKNHSVCNNMSIRVTVNDLENPLVSIPLNANPIKIDSPTYKAIRSTADQIMAKLQYICSLNQSQIKEVGKIAEPGNVKSDDDFITQLERLGALKEKGLITEEEWTQAKRKLLS